MEKGRTHVQRERRARRHGALGKGERRRRVELDRRSHRIGEVHRDQVVARRGRAQVRQAVAHGEAEPWVAEHIAVDARKLRLAHRHDVGIELGQVDHFQRRVLQQLFGGAAVAAADHQRAARIRVRDRRGMDQVLVIEELVALRGHAETVEAEDAAELGRLVDLEQLERRLATLDQIALEIDARRVGQALEDFLGHGKLAPGPRSARAARGGHVRRRVS